MSLPPVRTRTRPYSIHRTIERGGREGGERGGREGGERGGREGGERGGREGGERGGREGGERGGREGGERGRGRREREQAIGRRKDIGRRKVSGKRKEEQGRSGWGGQANVTREATGWSKHCTPVPGTVQNTRNSSKHTRFGKPRNWQTKKLSRHIPYQYCSMYD